MHKMNRFVMYSTIGLWLPWVVLSPLLLLHWSLLSLLLSSILCKLCKLDWIYWMTNVYWLWYTSLNILQLTSILSDFLLTPFLTPEQKAVMCNPSNPKLKAVNMTESRIWGIPITVPKWIGHGYESDHYCILSRRYNWLINKFVILFWYPNCV
jgi:hypothetical protein